MANPYDEYDLFDDWDEEGDRSSRKRESEGGTLRKQLEEVLAQNKQMAEFIQSVQRERAQTSLTQKIESRDLDPKVASLVPEGLSAADQDKWLDDNAALFAKRGTTPAPGQQPADQNTPTVPANAEEATEQLALTSTLTPSEIAALRATTADASASSGQPSGTTDPLAKLNTFDPATGNENEFWQFMRSQP
jgi:hypothetical protein